MANAAGLSQVYVGAARSTSRMLGGLFRSAVGSGHWERVTAGLPEPTNVYAITVHPERPEVVYLGTQDGPYRSVDRGARWERLGFPEAGKEIWSICVHPRNPDVLYAGASPVGVYRSDDGGDTWRRLPKALQPEMVKMSFACRVMRLAVDPTHPDEVYAALEVGGAMRSLDAGETWSDCSAELSALAERPHLKSKIQSDTEAEGMLDAHALCVSAAQPGTVFLAVRMGLFRSVDRGKTWQDMEVGRFSPLTYGRDVRVSPHDPRTLFACLSPASRSENGSLYRSQDLGQTWARFDHGLTPRSTMMGVALHPKDPAVVHCVTRHGQVFETQDAGRTWRESLLPDGVQDVYAVACG
jgi:photosystem II stability/assembly factor-like uncharacterized protein